jgi:hypothetical protein
LRFRRQIRSVNLITPNIASGTPANTGSPKLKELPITFRLPRVGQRDPWFHLSRAWYYNAEADGRLALIRLREKGKKRGATLIPSAGVLALLELEGQP